jgi:hypothetical protein
MKCIISYYAFNNMSIKGPTQLPITSLKQAIF